MGIVRRLLGRAVGPMTAPTGTIQRELIETWVALNEASGAGDSARAEACHLRLLAMGHLYFPEVLRAEDSVLTALNRGDSAQAKESQHRLKVAVYKYSGLKLPKPGPSQWQSVLAEIDVEARRIDEILDRGGDPWQAA